VYHDPAVLAYDRPFNTFKFEAVRKGGQSSSAIGKLVRALVYKSPGKVEMADWPRPCAGAGEVEIAVSAAGICGADVTGFLGRSRLRKPPLILGHELVGRTADGRRVVADPLITCGQCAECMRGATNLCRNLRLLGMDQTQGCFAEYVVVPEAQVHEISEDLDDVRAVLAEPLANIVHLFNLATLPPRCRMGIVGAGTMGSMALQMALRMGAGELLVEEVSEVRRVAAETVGATLAVNPLRAGGEARSFAGSGLDVVVDACGTDEARQEALDLCRPGGTVILLGLAKERSEINFSPSIRKELRVLMSFGYTRDDFKRSLDLLSAGTVDLGPWTAQMALEEGQLAFEKMICSREDTLKMILRV
jgi:2-desacetyl-2-hydroxyethyl bacteriochlorophyllide A dehydrogenase